MALLTLSEKRIICKSLNDFYKELESIDIDNMLREEIKTNIAKMSEIATLCSDVRYLPPIRYLRLYEVDLTRKERKLLITALDHTYRIKNREADSFSAPNISKLERELKTIEIIYNKIKY